jgi:hypothetical protein
MPRPCGKSVKMSCFVEAEHVCNLPPKLVFFLYWVEWQATDCNRNQYSWERALSLDTLQLNWQRVCITNPESYNVLNPQRRRDWWASETRMSLASILFPIVLLIWKALHIGNPMSDHEVYGYNVSDLFIRLLPNRTRVFCWVCWKVECRLNGIGPQNRARCRFWYLLAERLSIKPGTCDTTSRTVSSMSLRHGSFQFFRLLVGFEFETTSVFSPLSFRGDLSNTDVETSSCDVIWMSHWRHSEHARAPETLVTYVHLHEQTCLPS